MKIHLPEPSSRPDLLIIAGEASGDAHAARLLVEAKQRTPNLTVCALGGEALKAAGAQLLFDLTEHAVVGFFEVLKNYGFFRNLFRALMQWIRQHRPKAICLVDYPGFNLRLAKQLYQEKLSQKGGGAIPLVYYVSPQIWAWKTSRRFSMARLLDSLGVIFPFEVDCYADTDLPVHFVGHPLLEQKDAFQYDPDGPIVLLPGSRQAPVKRILPVMLAGLDTFRKQQGPHHTSIIYASEAIREHEAGILAHYPELQPWVSLNPWRDGQPASAVLMSSGTASLQVALAGIPGAIVYRAHTWTYQIGRRIVKVPYLGIANLLLKRPAWPEFIQKAAQPQVLASQLAQCLRDPTRSQQAMQDAHHLRALLGQEAAMAPMAWLTEALAGTSQTAFKDT